MPGNPNTEVMGVTAFKPPPEVNFCGNLSEVWKRWKQRYDLYVLATSTNTLPNEQQVAILLNLMGDQGIELYNTFNVSATAKVSEVLEQFEKYCNPRKNIVYERFIFFNAKQKPDQSIGEYIIELQTLSTSCEFMEKNNLCRDRLIVGLLDVGLQERLLRESNLTLEKAAEFCRTTEASRQQANAIQGQSSQTRTNAVERVDAVKTKEGTKAHFKWKKNYQSKSKSVNSFNNTNNTNNSNNTNKCSKCGYSHPPKSCPAYNKICAKCTGKNHFASVCRKEKKHVHIVDSECDTNNLFIHSLISSDSNKSWFKDVIVSFKEIQLYVNFKLDTGAEANILPLHTAKLLKIKKLDKTRTVLISFGDQRIKPEGEVILDCTIKNKSERHKIKFLIVDISNAIPILGLDACRLLKLIGRIDTVTLTKLEDKVSSKEQIIESYSDIFEGLGAFTGKKYHITLDQEVTPVISPNRRVPFSIIPELKDTIKSLEIRNVIKKINEPTEWVSPLVIVKKPKGGLRLCLDPKNLNKAIRREHHPIPNVEEILAGLEGKKLFSVLDLKDGFWHVKLDEDSSKVCTFTTPFGRYCFMRLPFGISSAPEVFQRKTSEAFGDIDGVLCYFDDLIISGATELEHDRALVRVLNRARELNIKFNKEKFQFKRNTVSYVGHEISHEGVRPDKKHIEAVVKLSYPKTKKELLRLLGLVKYVGKFIPNLSKITAPLRQLTQNNVEFKLQSQHLQSVDKLKKLLSTSPLLKTFDNKKPIIIQTDASRDGLGSALIQDGHVVSYASRSLNNAEKQYAQIEKEMLAISFACDKFHTFIYGRKVVVQSDHKPLESIFKKDLHKVTMRLQRLRMRLLKYDLSIVFTPGREMYIADTLSRDFLSTEGDNDPEIELVVLELIESLAMSKEKQKLFETETEKDSELSTLIKLCNTGWPMTKNKVPHNIQFYWNIKDDLMIVDGLVFLNKKVVVPEVLKNPMLKIIHEGHWGIVKCKSRARELLYWRGMDKDIEKLVQSCNVCTKLQNAKPKEPLLSHPVPNRSWERLGADILEFDHKYYLVVVDYYSNWIELLHISNKSASEIISKFMSIFARFGSPDIVVADNVPFNSIEFRNFGKAWNFEVITSSPNYQQSNGLAEKFVGICKKILKKSVESKQSPYISLLEYRNTRIERVGFSPAELLMSKKLKEKLPILKSLLSPKYINSNKVKNSLKLRKTVQKHYYNRHTKKCNEFIPQEDILFLKDNVWVPGKIIKKANAPRSYWLIDLFKKEFRRTSRHIRKRILGPISINGESDENENLEEKNVIGEEKNVINCKRQRKPNLKKDFLYY